MAFSSIILSRLFGDSNFAPTSCSTTDAVTARVFVQSAPRRARQPRRYAVKVTLQMFIKNNKTGFKHEKCFLNSRRDCSSKISREHYISSKLLNVIERKNKTIDVAGLSWLSKEKIKSIGKANLVSNILCTKHNSDLSDLDSSIGKFVEYLSEIDKNFQTETSSELNYEVNGREIEQWILKTILGLIHSGNIQQSNGKQYTFNEKLIVLLCEPSKRWPLGWGLYVSIPKDKIHHSNSFEIIPMSNRESGEILAVQVKFNGFEMTLCLGKPDIPALFGVFRPTSLVFTKENIVSKITIKWPVRNKGESVTFCQIGTYAGLAPTHNIDRA